MLALLQLLPKIISYYLMIGRLLSVFIMYRQERREKREVLLALEGGRAMFRAYAEYLREKMR